MYGDTFLAGSSEGKIVDLFSQIYRDGTIHERLAKKRNPFGDGKASERIHQYLMLDRVQAFIKNYPLSSEDSLGEKRKHTLKEEEREKNSRTASASLPLFMWLSRDFCSTGWRTIDATSRGILCL